MYILVDLSVPIEGEISTIDPGISLDTASVEITEQLFLGLTEFEYVDSKYKIVPELAESWTIHEGGTVYRFKMRKDVYWVSGVNGERLSPVTSNDVCVPFNVTYLRISILLMHQFYLY
jgi:ABC-type transport system substrate-binding protein